MDLFGVILVFVAGALCVSIFLGQWLYYGRKGKKLSIEDRQKIQDEIQAELDERLEEKRKI
jgi:hypothetical protein